MNLNIKNDKKIEIRKSIKEASCFLFGNYNKRKHIKNHNAKNYIDFHVEKQFSKYKNFKCFNINNGNNFPFLKEQSMSTKKERIYSSSKNERNFSRRIEWNRLSKLFTNIINNNEDI